MKIEASLRVEAHGARSLSTLSTFSTFHDSKECISSKECVMNFITMHTHAHTCTRLNQASVYTHGNLGCFSIITNVFCSHRCRFRITWLIIRIVFSGLVVTRLDLAQGDSGQLTASCRFFVFFSMAAGAAAAAAVVAPPR